VWDRLLGLGGIPTPGGTSLPGSVVRAMRAAPPTGSTLTDVGSARNSIMIKEGSCSRIAYGGHFTSNDRHGRAAHQPGEGPLRRDRRSNRGSHAKLAARDSGGPNRSAGARACVNARKAPLNCASIRVMGSGQLLGAGRYRLAAIAWPDPLTPSKWGCCIAICRLRPT
jgi:hypothetical protein